MFISVRKRRWLDIVNFPVGKLGILSRAIRKIQNNITSNVITKVQSELAQTVMNKVQPDCLLRDTGSDLGLRKELIEKAKEKNLSVIIVPHGSDIHMENESVSSVRNMYGHYLLCPSQYMHDYYVTVDESIKRIVVGNPRYDRWWINRIRDCWNDGK